MMKARRPTNESGFALVMVIGVGAVVAIMLVTAISFALAALKSARSDEQWNAALAAAYAGVEEYRSRLTADPGYAAFGNPAAAFTTESGSSAILPTAGETNPAFGTGASGAWANVPGSDGTATYRYEVNNADFAATGTLTLRSTGKVGDQTRSVVVQFRQQGFLDYLYFTDYELQEPDQVPNRADNCIIDYAWATRQHHPNCGEIYFLPDDELDGPVHSNDIIRACGTTFTGPVTTAWARTSGIPILQRTSQDYACSPAPSFHLPGYPRTVPRMGLPATNSELKRLTRTDLADVPRPGCLYSGPTDIRLNSNGTMTVRSPWTQVTRTAGDPETGGSTPAECGSITALRSPAGATVAVSSGRVVYVQDVPAVAADPNFWADGTAPTLCRGADGTTAGNGVGYPASGERAPNSASYGCRSGDAFVSGELRGALTIAAANIIYLTADVTYRDPATDILGLIGNNSVVIWNPVTASGTSLLGGDHRTIYAALLSVGHSVQVQNLGSGGFRGTLTVHGSIIQKFRGGVYRDSNGVISGYTKDYSYDTRFTHLSPPHFLSPASVSFSTTVWAEVAAAYSSNGDAR
jgi:Tfp pilus assembly protein PilE